VGLIQAAESAGFATVDALLRFSFDLESPLPKAPSPPAWVREAKPGDVPALRAMAEHGFVLDRFHADRAVPPATADRLHAEWVEAAALGRTGSGLLVAESGAGLAGFFIQGEDGAARDALGFGVGQLVLIAVDEAWRGRGIGGLLTRSSLAWHRARGNRYAEVGTQLANVPATNLYLGSGCRLADTSVTLRWWDETAS
jgi:ribosomal protein S18 acetylase RimI-like enzyme